MDRERDGRKRDGRRLDEGERDALICGENMLTVFG